MGDLKNRVLLQRDFTRPNQIGSSTSDQYGHGTHIAWIVAGSGNGSRSLTSAAFTGMAPGAGILNLKVLNADGSPWLYFDLERDPGETVNLAVEPARAAEMAELAALSR